MLGTHRASRPDSNRDGWRALRHDERSCRRTPIPNREPNRAGAAGAVAGVCLAVGGAVDALVRATAGEMDAEEGTARTAVRAGGGVGGIAGGGEVKLVVAWIGHRGVRRATLPLTICIRHSAYC